MEKYITDERTGIRYELVGDYYLPIDFGILALQGFYRIPIVYLMLNLYSILVRNLRMETKI